MSSDRLDLVFRALADPTRRQLVDRLFAHPGLTLGQLTSDLQMSRQAASKHLAILEAAGLMTVHWEGREKLHYFNPVPIAQIAARWLNRYSQTHAGAIVALQHALEGKSNEQTRVPVRRNHRRAKRKGVGRADER